MRLCFLPVFLILLFAFLVYLSHFFTYTHLKGDLNGTQCKCKNFLNNARPRVVNGSEVTNFDDLPWSAVFYKTSKLELRSFCSGTGKPVVSSHIYNIIMLNI